MARKGLYSKTFTLPNGKRKYVTAKTAAELDQKVLNLRLQMRMGVDLSDNTTFGELLQLWYNTEQKGKTRDNTGAMLKGIMNNHIMPYLSRYRVKDITPVMIKNVMNHSRNLNIGLNRRILGVLRSSFDLAVENHLITTSPVLRRFKAEGKPISGRVALTPDQETEILTVSKKYPDKYLLLLTADCTGMRCGELLGLMWDSVNLEKKTVSVRRSVIFGEGGRGIIRDELKTETSRRVIPIPDILCEELKKSKAKTNSLFVFHLEDGSCYNERDIQRVNRFLKTHTGPDPERKKIRVITEKTVDMHTFRHTYATRMFEAGLDVKEVQTLLGHATPDTTLKIYTHYREKSRQLGTFDKARSAFSCTTSVPQQAVN